MAPEFFRTTRSLVSVLGLCVLLVACGAEQSDFEAPTGQEGGPDEDPSKRESIFGQGGLQLFGDDDDNTGGGAGIGVNSFLWRATLDTISFMPIRTADPFGGVITTDWHTTVGSTDERFKINVFILTPTLRADGLRVAVFGQRLGSAGWQDSVLPSETSVKIEDAILTRARQLRRQTIDAQAQ